MRVVDFCEHVHVSSTHELEHVLHKRYERKENEFWLSHDDAQYPALSIAVLEDAATVHYFPTDHHAGFQSVSQGTQSGSGMCRFYISKGGQEIEVLKDGVIPFPVALVVAKQFFASKELPTSIEWVEL